MKKITTPYFTYLCCTLVWTSLFMIISCSPDRHIQDESNEVAALDQEIIALPSSPHLVVLGITQDAGYPQIDCKEACCTSVWKDKSKRKMVSCLGLRDPSSGQVWIFDATPDFKDQLNILTKGNTSATFDFAGVFLTHAHMGHYTGLMHLGREALGAREVPVYAMPRMKDFLESNGPWDQLVKLQNISLKQLTDRSAIQLTQDLSVTPLQVPHRDEYSETVGFIIKGQAKSALFIPDIDKWEKWDTDINALIKTVDYAFLDGSFYQNGEIPGRDMSMIPHPFISESITRFDKLEEEQKKKIHFIHFNHTNPLLNSTSAESIEFSKTDYQLAFEGQVLTL